MGLYDVITIRHKEFPEEHRGVEFQTKGLHNLMEEYKITPSGLLYRRDVKRELYANPESPLGVSSRELSSKWLRKTDLEGDIGVYTQLKSWVEYTLVFKSGKLVSWELSGARRGGSVIREDRYA